MPARGITSAAHCLGCVIFYLGELQVRLDGETRAKYERWQAAGELDWPWAAAHGCALLALLTCLPCSTGRSASPSTLRKRILPCRRAGRH